MQTDMRSLNRYGFTLVELSIALVIIGLLVGGVLSGQSLIRAAELRAATSEYQRYSAAIHAFRDKYAASPGDFRDATKFWNLQGSGGTAVAGCSSSSGVTTVSDSGSCDGNGDGVLSNASAANTSGEAFQFWRQLALAGLIEGSYNGLAGSGGDVNDVPGTNTPKSKVNNGGWGVHNRANYAGDGVYYQYDFGNFLVLGSAAPGSYRYADLALLKPEEAWNIDTKLDDGLPGAGKVVANEGTGVRPRCATSTLPTDKPGAYNLTNISADCSLSFVKQF